jgi:uracil-DNA glycosylase
VRHILNDDWKKILLTQFKMSYFEKLEKRLSKDYEVLKCYPNINDIFKAFNLCRFDKLKVVIIGQDPYHGFNEANGLAFSVNKEINIPPSLKNILKEVEADIGKTLIKHGDLSKWATQGVLLLNSILTVKENQPMSHKDLGWEIFTNEVIKIICDKLSNIVFLLWGNNAKKKIKYINKERNFVLLSGHPSPLSANRGYWFNNKHFSQTNNYLISKKKDPIIW